MLQDGDLRGWTPVDVLPAHGMQEVRGSNPLSSTSVQIDKFEILSLPFTSLVQQQNTAAKYSSAAARCACLPAVIWSRHKAELLA